jgi:hypothetical protein
MDTYALEKLTGWTPELSPPPDSPLYRWRVLAGDVQPSWHGDARLAAAVLANDLNARPLQDNVIPGRVEDANPESRDSGSSPSDHPGMTIFIT